MAALRGHFFCMHYVRVITTLIVCIIFLILGGFFSFFFYPVVDLSVLHQHDNHKPTIVLDDQGQEWARFHVDQRTPIGFSEFPNYLTQAFIATEDHSFWEHRGISLRGIIRSTLINIYNGRIVQGASTITQQLVKLLFFDSRKTFGRKFKEQILALYVEQHTSKEHILQVYLNSVYFGCGIYGVEAASQRFWGKSARQLTLDQAATLAGIVKSPQNYCPLLYPLSAKKRRDIVLQSMQRIGFINTEECNNAQQLPIVVKTEIETQLAPHAKEAIRIFLEQTIGKHQLYTGGLVVQTTFNRAMQESAQKMFDAQCALLKKNIHPSVDGALICMEVKTGEIKAMVGGANFEESKFNRALQARRQFGSIFKPIIFSAAIAQGLKFNATELDEPLELPIDGTVWKPHNYTHTFDGQITLARALSHSSNIVTIKTLLKIGINNAVKLAQKFHLSDPLLPYPSLALGCVDGTLKEATALFNVFAHDGVFVEPHMIRWVKDHWGTKIWKHTHTTERILPSIINSQVAKILTLGMERYRNKFAHNWLTTETQSIGKTGTTNDCRTCWFCGSTPTYTTAIYIGCDDNRSMGKDVYPTQTAFPLWVGFNRSLQHLHTHFTWEPSLKEIIINDRTGDQSYYKWNNSYINILVPA